MTLKEAIKKYREQRAEKRKGYEEIKKTRTEALHTERLKQAKISAAQQAKIEREVQIKRIKERGVDRGIAGAISKRVNIAAKNLGYDRGDMLGTSIFGPAPGIKKAKKKKQKREMVYVRSKGGKIVKLPIVKKPKKKSRKQSRGNRGYESYNPFAMSIR